MDEDNRYLNDLLGVLKSAEEKERRNGLANSARQIRAMYDAFLAEGFTDRQAFTLTVKMLEIGTANGRGRE